jgi:hypothetical protein
MDFDYLLSAMPYGDKWRRARKLLHSYIYPGAVPAYQFAQLSSARRFVRDLLGTKHDKNVLPRIVRAYFGRTIIKMTYGIDVKSGEDEYIAIPEKVLQAINEAAIPGRFFVDAVPFCECPMSSVISTSTQLGS